jgi:hypothetical protein
MRGARVTLRGLVATIGGLAFLVVWVAAGMVGGDLVRHAHPALAFLYYATAGFVWVFPIWWLMIWAARRR